jgi:hypothetical protein
VYRVIVQVGGRTAHGRLTRERAHGRESAQDSVADAILTMFEVVGTARRIGTVGRVTPCTRSHTMRENETGLVVQCGARTRTGAPCQTAKMANGRCRMHGGLTPKGIASVHFTHGRYSWYLPARLAERCEQAQTDPRLLEYRDDIGLVDARIGELLARIGSHESGETWKDLRECWREVERLRASTVNKGVTGREKELDAFGACVRRGLDDHLAWEEIGAQLDRRVRLVSAERRRLAQLESTVTADEARSMVAVVTGILQRHVEDPRILSAIAADLDAHGCPVT